MTVVHEEALHWIDLTEENHRLRIEVGRLRHEIYKLERARDRAEASLEHERRVNARRWWHRRYRGRR